MFQPTYPRICSTRDTLIGLTLAYPLLSKNFLRNTSVAEDQTDIENLPENIQRMVLDPAIPVLSRWHWCKSLLRSNLAMAYKRNIIDGFQLQLLEERILRMSSCMGVSSRIKSTPLAFGLGLHVRTVLIVYLMGFPHLLLSNGHGYAFASMISMLIAYSLLAVDEVSVQCEQPFGFDASDLPLEAYCNIMSKQTKTHLLNDPHAIAVKYLEESLRPVHGKQKASLRELIRMSGKLTTVRTQ